MTISTLEYALMAGNAYQSNTNKENKRYRTPFGG
jgi:hypothetical protein